MGCGGITFEDVWNGWYRGLFYRADDNPALMPMFTQPHQRPSLALSATRAHAATGCAPILLIVVSTRAVRSMWGLRLASSKSQPRQPINASHGSTMNGEHGAQGLSTHPASLDGLVPSTQRSLPGCAGRTDCDREQASFWRRRAFAARCTAVFTLAIAVKRRDWELRNCQSCSQSLNLLLLLNRLHLTPSATARHNVRRCRTSRRSGRLACR